MRIPNANELNDEISDLYRLANRAFCVIELKGCSARLTSKGHNTLPVKTGIAEMFESLAEARENLSVEATELLNSHGTSELPSPNALRDVKQREGACRVIAEFCSFGGSFVSSAAAAGWGAGHVTIRALGLTEVPQRISGFVKRQATIELRRAFWGLYGKKPLENHRLAPHVISINRQPRLGSRPRPGVGLELVTPRLVHFLALPDIV